MAGFEKLISIMDTLRSDDGCPWDREQTRDSLKTYLIEEAYELLEALDEGEPEKIKEELGDLLFQIVFHVRIASERGEFNMDDVIDTITEKMIARHPHVFGEMRLTTPEEVIGRWEEHKRKEGKLRESLFDGIPAGLPSLLKAFRVQERAARVGFDWRKTSEVIRKLEAEFNEFRDSVRKGVQTEIEDELGDLFFTLVNLSRFLEINPEDVLQKTTMRFISRFRYIEEHAKREGRGLKEYSLEEMNTLWEENKHKE